jgi:YHS domain-containing protein
MRLLIFLIAAYLAFRVLKSWLGGSGRLPADGRPAGPIDDEMVQDPFCRIYFPKSGAVILNHGGRQLFFCSTRCRDKFLETNARPPADG